MPEDGKYERELAAVVIGGSAGSIPVLCEMLAGLPKDFSLPVIICVHRMRNVSEGIREVFALKSHLSVVEPDDKMPVEDAHVYISPSNYHLLIEKDFTFSLSTEPLVNYSRPSIDVTLSSAAAAYGRNLAGILLTGANKDGAAGMEQIKKCGGLTIVQDPLKCAAPFMPLAAIEKNCIDLILPPEEIFPLVYNYRRRPALHKDDGREAAPVFYPRD